MIKIREEKMIKVKNQKTTAMIVMTTKRKKREKLEMDLLMHLD